MRKSVLYSFEYFDKLKTNPVALAAKIVKRIKK